MNKVILIGRLAQNPQFQTAQSGTSVCTFSIAVNRSSQAAVQFFNITTWGKLAENCNAFLKKGSRVCVQGYIKLNYYEVDNVKKLSVEIPADDVEFLSPKKESEKKVAQ